MRKQADRGPSKKEGLTEVATDSERYLAASSGPQRTASTTWRRRHGANERPGRNNSNFPARASKRITCLGRPLPQGRGRDGDAASSRAFLAGRRLAKRHLGLRSSPHARKPRAGGSEVTLTSGCGGGTRMFQSSRPPPHADPAAVSPPHTPGHPASPSCRGAGGSRVYVTAAARRRVRPPAEQHRAELEDPSRSRAQKRDARRGGRAATAGRAKARGPGPAPAYLRRLRSGPAPAPAGGRGEAAAGRRQ
uniref:Uncharacterized protein LOC112835023 n=1 Tax=Callorhinus ursinus TaxID=34884 RepID=A0A3Q7Q990_CALUR|nr:uncharacterized protein LOC112835023 [Callorhinus ursinus]